MSGEDREKLLQVVLDRLRKVIDPETGVDVMRMRLVEEIDISPEGYLSYVFRPSSPYCPIAVPLLLEIINTIKEIPSIQHQEVKVVDYVQADELNEMIKDILEK